MGHFTSKRVRMSAGIGSCVSDECVRHLMHRAGLRYRRSRRKGLLTQKDLKLRLAFARKVKRILNPEFWKCGISFRLDGVSFTHKLNPSDQAEAPRTMAWRRPGEGLMFNPIQYGGGALWPPYSFSLISPQRLEVRPSNFLTFSFYLLAIRKI